MTWGARARSFPQGFARTVLILFQTSYPVTAIVVILMLKKIGCRRVLRSAFHPPSLNSGHGDKPVPVLSDVKDHVAILAEVRACLRIADPVDGPPRRMPTHALISFAASGVAFHRLASDACA